MYWHTTYTSIAVLAIIGFPDFPTALAVNLRLLAAPLDAPPQMMPTPQSLEMFEPPMSKQRLIAPATIESLQAPMSKQQPIASATVESQALQAPMSQQQPIASATAEPQALQAPMSQQRATEQESSPPVMPSPASLPPGVGDTTYDFVQKMLPSTFNVVETSPMDTQHLADPFKRPKCAEVMTSMETSATNNRNLNSLQYNSMKLIIEALQIDPEVLRARNLALPFIDKAIASALKGAKHALSGPYSLEWMHVQNLRNCAVDDEGRTIFMKIVLNGYSDSIKEPYAMAMGKVLYHDLIDKKGNNIIHLAVESGSMDIVAFVTSIVGTPYLLDLLKARNKLGDKPVDIAIRMNNGEIVSRLKHLYRERASAEMFSDALKGLVARAKL